MTTLFENLEHGDLKRLVKTSLHIDEYKSKMGDDEDICVLSFKVNTKEPAMDLVSFIEKGYDWVLDADVSSGEKQDGEYLVFVEIDRTKNLPDQINQLVDDMLNLTQQEKDEWTFRYRKSSEDLAITSENLAMTIPLTPSDYNEKYEKPKEENQKELDSLKAAAGINVDSKAPKNEFTESLRALAGIN